MKNFIKKIIVYILQLEAQLVLRKYQPKVIAVTGSVGKTLTKDAIYAALKTSFFIRKSQKSFNSEIGIPLTILGCANAWNNPLKWIKNIFEGFALIFLKNHYPKWLVLEVGADRPGDIENITKWLKPDVVVITAFGEVPVHVEFFNSVDQLVEEKSYLVKALKKDGILITSIDDKQALDMKNKTNSRVMTFGFKEGAQVKASNEQILYDTEGKGVVQGITFKVDYGNNSLPARLNGVFGRNHIHSALAGLAVGLSQDLNMVTMLDSLSTYNTPPGRLKLLPGIKNSFILDDTYNSSPIAAEAAIKALQEIELKGKRIAVLGDMLELGKYSVEEHKKLGEMAAAVCDVLVTVGLRAKDITQGALVGGLNEENIYQFEEAAEAGKFLESLITEGDVILVKGSQGVRMEKTVEEIMLHPENKHRLLVRQDVEWLSR